MRILVTGHCGFIGQNFVRMFSDEHSFVGIDKLGYASDQNATQLCFTHTLDLSDNLFLSQCEEIIKENDDFDAIVNFAAESHVDNSIKSPGVFIQSNIVGTFNLLEIARKFNIPKFIQISTDEVYGDLSLEDAPFSDPDVLRPSSPYSASKTSADLLVQSYFRTFGLNGCIVRSCNNYGPHQFEEKLIPVVITRALEDKKIPIYGTGKNVREWIYVQDNCQAIMSVLQFGENHRIYNLGSGVEKTNLELVGLILDKMNKPRSLIEFVEDRKGHDYRYALDSSLIRAELNWGPRVGFDEGLERTIDYYSRKEYK